ncbi:hypothetical protein ACLIMP_13765 [Novosphingobium aerophilum]|uniref:hypothetical protein n=1 Tax=Novosphingobium TaxID=165696 RepID=UPI0006C8DB59|nr:MULTISPECIES: hypothetical protein [unclassified Novosphingobium]KPH59592.1 hypothetical protein ADT71_22685 [Novosphingobium sp. ST904]MPS69993.1 hypothetical protein [Novosphingobium sp.]TCM38047.1 hypothetical protein EDF59_109106 [Novosphingobium sp. ST904]WRT92325.1 hypothetical protein U9J33_14090 [Novosphingobium sp. RL4]
MTEQDPARARFATIQLVRIFGVACVIAGMAIGAEKLAAPLWLGYLLIANGLIDVFVIPKVLARKWRSPK